MKTSNSVSVERLLFLSFAVALVLLTSASAQVQSMSTAQLAEESTTILVGTCTGSESSWNETKTKILTRVKIKADEYVKGNLGSEAVVTIPGGRVGNIVYEVSDMPSFREGEEVVVFLWKHPSGQQLVTGAQQGKLTIEKDALTGKKILKGVPKRDVSALGLKKGSAAERIEQKVVTLEEFLQEVKGHVKH